MNFSTSNPAPNRWSMTPYFSEFGGEDYEEFKKSLKASLLEALKADDSPVTDEILRWEELGVRFGHLSSFLSCLSSDDAQNEAVRMDEAWLKALGAERSKLGSRLNNRLARMKDGEFATLLAEDGRLDGAKFAVERMRLRGQRQMALDQEALAADLCVDGLHAWGRLYETISGKLSFSMKLPDGREQMVPMAKRRALMADPNRDVRIAAFHDGQKPWVDHEDSLAAGLNGISGSRLTLYRWRKVDHFLDIPLLEGALTKDTLDAMLTVIFSNIETSRRILRASAKLQGTKALHFYDLEAPQIPPPDAKPISWNEACAMVDRSFSAAYPSLAVYFRRMLEMRWIEAQPRANKRPGAFCTGSKFINQERVYMTYHDTVHDVVTLAHEVGHAWHSHVLRDARPFASNYPMTLAETASNFGEMILLDGLKRESAASPEMLAHLLDQDMLRAHANLLNIPMRYEFERTFYEERRHGEVPVSKIKELMSAAQNHLYGDTLEPGGTDPMFWASKMHFFITGVSFYNFPYVFGYLLSQALYARFKKEGASFLPAYETFLARTGSADCETVARETLGADLRDPDFWESGIRSLLPSVDAYEKLAAGA